MGQTVYLGLCLLAGLLLSPFVEGASNATVVETRARCPAGSLYYKQFCYQLVNSYVSWHLAEVTCQGMNYGPEAHLASLLSSSEGKIVSSYLNSKSASNVWIGLEATRENGYMSWGWSDASALSLPLWDGRSLSTSVSANECIAMTNILNSNALKWVQRACTDTLPFLCKFKAGY
ncbi:lithostathine-like [Paroedura picta]|uniref:lithostathine-like n=1 Tax=Paroedura picta TaxID=143630 RepID=UPI004056510B